MKNQHKTSFLVERILSGIAVVVLLGLTAALLVFVLLGGAPKSQQYASSAISSGDQFAQDAEIAISEAMPSLQAGIRSYRITGNIPPKPGKKNYGSVTTIAEMEPILAAAQTLLDGQELYFSSIADYQRDYGIQYYQDPSILAITWKNVVQNTMYTFSEIKIADASQFRRYLAGGEYGSGKLYYATDMASTVHAVVAISGDYFEYRNNGVIVYDGKVRRVGSGADTCYIDRNGDMIFTKLHASMNADSANRFVEEKNILFSLAFGPVLVENGQLNDVGGYPLGEVNYAFPRAALCQMDDLHYLLITANTEGDARAGTTMYAFAQQVYATGCKMAYALDGGQTAALVMDNVLVNSVYRGYQRKISDIIYFATAVN